MHVDSFRAPITLAGRHVRLVPLDPSHSGPLGPVWANPEVHRYLIGLLPRADGSDLRQLIDLLLSRQESGTDLAFTTLRVSDARPIGMTRYLNIDRKNDAVEIGGTWLDPECWRTPVNTESKLLLLSHAFEHERAHRVCLQTDLRNERSQRAIARLGAEREAVLREDRRLTDDGYRTSVFFSILKSEWPGVKHSLEQMLATPWTPESTRHTGPLDTGATTGFARNGREEVGVLPASSFRPPVVLRGQYVELVPLDRSHIPALARAGGDPEIWQLLRIGPGRNESEMTALVDWILGDQEAGTVLAFVVLALPSRTPVGMFRFLDIDRWNRKVEGGTWLHPGVWRSPVNSELKYLALSYAFEREGVHRVQFRTDSRNVRSQRAIERLGAVSEGVHREHIVLADGFRRSSLVYSILEKEWPSIKRQLEEKLAQPWTGGDLASLLTAKA